MAEMSVNVYFKHNDPDTHRQLVQLFEHADPDGDDECAKAFVDLATKLNPDRGKGIVEAFLHDLRDRIREMFGFEDVADVSGFCVAGGIRGGSGDKFAGRCVKFLYHLCPDVQALAWGMGDDDPWEFWFKHVDGRLVRHDDEPFNGYDNRIRGTIYRWWHEGLPDAIREGMLNDEDFDAEDDDEEDPAVSDAEYEQWIAGQHEGSDLEDDVEEVVMDEMVDAFTNALGSLFSGGTAKKAVSKDAFDCEAIDEDAVRAVLADMDDHEKAFDVDGIMKHISKQLKGEIQTSVEGKQTTMPLTHSLYRMSLKLVLREDMEYESEQVITDISVDDGVARVMATSDMACLDPMTGKKMQTSTKDAYTLEIVDGKIQVTELNSIEAG